MNDETKSAPYDDLFQVKTAAAVLATCVVETAQKLDPTFQKRFLETLYQAYDRLKDDRRGSSEAHDLEVLSWTKELLTGSAWGTGQGKPFLDGEGK